MSLRTSSALAACAILAACSPGEDAQRRAPMPRATAPTPAPKATPDGPVRVACAHGDAPLAPGCVLEEGVGGEGALVVRFDDGGFRRITVTGDGRGVVAADGAAPARVTMVDAAPPQIEVLIGDDRFRLPVGGSAGDSR